MDELVPDLPYDSDKKLLEILMKGKEQKFFEVITEFDFADTDNNVFVSVPRMSIIEIVKRDDAFCLNFLDDKHGARFAKIEYHFLLNLKEITAQEAKTNLDRLEYFRKILALCGQDLRLYKPAEIDRGAPPSIVDVFMR